MKDFEFLLQMICCVIVPPSVVVTSSCLGGSKMDTNMRISACGEMIGSIYCSTTFFWSMVLFGILSLPTSLYILQTLAKRGANAIAKVIWKLHIRTMHVAFMFGPSRAKLDELNKAHPTKKMHVKYQSW